MADDPFQPAPIPSALQPFIDTSTGMLIHFPRREFKRGLALDWIAAHLPSGATFTEREFNAVLARLHEDTASARRYLVETNRVYRPEPGTYVVPD